MDLEEYIDKMKVIQENILTFIDNDDDVEENYENLIKNINSKGIQKDKYLMKTFLYLLIKLVNNHYRNLTFFGKIEKILKELKKEISEYFTNWELFKIFKKNKRILLFLIEEHIITIDQNIYHEMLKCNYLEYFSPEIKTFFEDDKTKTNPDFHPKDMKIFEFSEEDPQIFNEKRKKGENDGYLCQIIRNDSIEDFIIYVNQKDYPVNSIIEESIYETNQFLLKQQETTLIEYSAFFGSTQIFKYLLKNNAELTSKLWLYAIHGNDEEIIHLLEENNVKSTEFDSYKDCLIESIKCHNMNIFNYIEDRFDERNENLLRYNMKYYNFLNFPDEMICNDVFFYACEYDYFKIVEFLMNTKKIDINNKCNDILKININ